MQKIIGTLRCPKIPYSTRFEKKRGLVDSYMLF